MGEAVNVFYTSTEGFHDFLARIQVHGHNHLQERLRNTIQIEIEVLGLER